MKRTCGRLVLALLLCPVLAACAGSETEGFRTEERDGVTWVLNTGSGVWDESAPPVEFALEQTFGVDMAPEEAMLGDVAYVDVDDEGTVYVLDRQSSRLVAFGPGGEVLWRTGSEGEGPGELQQPRGMALDGAGSLFVANQSGSALDQFDLQGEFLARYRVVEAGIEDFRLDGFLAPGLMVGHDALMGAIGVTLQVLRAGEPLELVAERDLDLYPELDVPAGVSAGGGVRVAGDEILVGHNGRYEIRVFDGSLEPLRVVSRPEVDHLVRPGVGGSDGGRIGIAGMSTLGTPVVFPDGRWLVHSTWPTGVDDPDEWVRHWLIGGEAPERGPTGRALDFFDADGRYLGGFQWVGDEDGPDIGRPALVGPGGKLYTTLFDPFPQVRRYRVVFRDDG